MSLSNDVPRLAPDLAALAALLSAVVLGGCDGSSPAADGARLGAAGAQLTRSSSLPIRQISVRSPYGDVAATGNLALDGDFELEQGASSSWWLVDATGDYDSPTFATGGRCRSGLYCADVGVGLDLLGLDVPIRPRTAGTFTFAAKPAGACSDVHGELDLLVDPEGVVYDAFVAQPASASPGADGWCTYTAHYTADRPQYQATELELFSASETLFDDVVVVEAPEARSLGESERRAGDPRKGREMAAGRRKAREVGERRAAAMGDPRGKRGKHGG